MRRASFADMNCSIAQSLELLGEWWTLLIVRDAFFGVTRFEEFQSRLGIARNILTKRLDALVDGGVLERRMYDDAHQRYEYVLTKKGRALWPVLVTLRQWGDEWIVGLKHASVASLHTACGAKTTAHLTCDHCGEPIDGRELRVVAGPGLRDGHLLPSAGGANRGPTTKRR